MALLWPRAGVSAQAPQPEAQEGLTVRRIEIEGHQNYTEAYLLSLIRTAVGGPYSLRQVQEDVRRIQRTGKFLDAVATPRIEDGQVVLLFSVSELPTIAEVRFEGNARFKDDELAREISVAAGGPLERFAIEQGRDAILCRTPYV